MKSILKLLGSFALMFVLAFLIGMPAFAQETAEVVQEVVQPTYLDKVLGFIGASGSVVAALIMMAEFLMRAFPSKKPLSLLIPAAYALHGISKIAGFLGMLADKMIEIANNVKPK